MMATGKDKRPFDQLVSRIPRDLLGQQVGLRLKEAQKYSFNPALEKFRSALKDGPHSHLDRFGALLGLSTARVNEVMAAADEDRGKQMDYLLLAWVELFEKKATVEAVLRALYAADDTQVVEHLAKELTDTGVTERHTMIPTKASYDSVVMPSPPTHVLQPTHFIGETEEGKLSQRLAQMSVIPNIQATKRLESQSDVELPPDLSLQKPLEETSLTKNMTVHVEPASDTTDHNKSIEAQMPVEESWLDTAVDTATSSAVVSSLTSFTAQQQRVVTSVNDTTFEEKHEMVSGDGRMERMERMESDIEDLRKNMRRVESDLEEMQSVYQRERLHQAGKNEELDRKLRQLEDENEKLKATVVGLQDELKKTKEKLQEALKEVAKLRNDNTSLNEVLTKERVQFQEERERFKEENESLHKKAANTEREKAELRDSLEEQASKLRECQEHYEKELNKVRAELQSVKREIKERKDQNATDSPGEVSRGGETGEWLWKDRLGAGGFGEVFKAQRKGSLEVFAAKRITIKDSDQFDTQTEMVSSFLREMKASQQCKHPRIVQYVDRTIETGDSCIHFYLIMEFMSQGSLADLLKKKEKLNEKLEVLTVKKYTRQLLEGLQYLHRQNVIHRDIKCSNILLDDKGEVKLADFGCSKFTRSKVSSGGRLTGTAWWMAPELVPGGKHSQAASEKSDVWSVGATVVEMLTGKRPFHEYKEKMAVIFGLGEQKLSLEKLICGPGFSEEVQEFLRLCINWNPSERAPVAKLMETQFCSLE